jgi:hypothetical protein
MNISEIEAALELINRILSKLTERVEALEAEKETTFYQECAHND